MVLHSIQLKSDTASRPPETAVDENAIVRMALPTPEATQITTGIWGPSEAPSGAPAKRRKHGLEQLRVTIENTTFIFCIRVAPGPWIPVMTKGSNGVRHQATSAIHP